MAIGSTCALLWGGKNANGSSTNLSSSTLTDSRSNTWTLRQNALYSGTANQRVESGIYTSTLTTGIQIGDTVTITYTASLSVKMWIVFEFPAATAYSNSGKDAAGTTGTSPSITTASISNGHYVVGLVTNQNNNDTITFDTDTSNGSWSSGVMVNASSTNTLVTQYKRVTGTATQSYDLTVPSSNYISSWVDLTAPVVATNIMRRTLNSIGSRTGTRSVQCS
jgi:hypothetical protein